MSEAEVGFSVGVDEQRGEVVLDLELAKEGEPIKVRLCYTPGEAAEFAMAIVKAAQEAQKLPQPPRVVLPNGNGKLKLSSR